VTTPAPLHVRLTGTPTLALDGAEAPALRHRKGYAVLFHLAAADGPVDRDALLDLLWSDKDGRAARNNLRVVLSDLKKHYGAYLAIDRRQVAFAPGAPVATDLAAFRAWARGVAADGEASGPQLLHGAFLDGFDDAGAAPFATWVRREREAVRSEAYDAFDRAARAAEGDGRLDDALALWRRAADVRPWAEEAYQAMIRVASRAGAIDAAEAAFEECRIALRDHLGIEPSSTTVGLVHRAVGPKIAAPLQSETAWARLPLIGRERDVADVAALVADPAVRLVSVVGAPGVGTSRVAYAATRRVRDRAPGGTVRVPLHGVLDVPFAWSRVAVALGLPGQEDERRVDHERFAALQTPHGGGAVHVILDDAHPDLDVASSLAAWLRARDDVTVVHVGREPLGLDGERVHVVAPLPRPRTGTEIWPDAWAEQPAVALGLAAARRLGADGPTTLSERRQVTSALRALGGHPVATILAMERAARDGVAALATEGASGGALLDGADRHPDASALSPWHRSLRRLYGLDVAALPGPVRQVAVALASAGAPATAEALAERTGLAPDLVARALGRLDARRWLDPPRGDGASRRDAVALTVPLRGLLAHAPLDAPGALDDAVPRSVHADARVDRTPPPTHPALRTTPTGPALRRPLGGTR
jgi:DNA-binding SARP family transcriptional activator